MKKAFIASLVLALFGCDPSDPPTRAGSDGGTPGLDGGGGGLGGAGGMVGAGAQNSATLAEYIGQLPPKEREALVQGIEPSTVEAMRRLVDFMLDEGGGPGSGVLCRMLSDRASGRSSVMPHHDGFWHW